MLRSLCFIIDVLVYEQNKKINEHLINTLEHNDIRTNILFTSSIHENRDTFYGKSKLDSTSYFQDICNLWNKDFVKLIFPNIFGPFAKPNHTSVVATFCNDVILNKKSIINNVDLELIYVDQAINSILNFKEKKDFSKCRVNLLDLHKRIQNLYEQYCQNESIILKDTLDVQLFTTLKSHII